MSAILKPSFVLLTHTATSDDPFRLADGPCMMIPADITVQTNDAYMGDEKNQTYPIFAGDTYTATQSSAVDLSQIWFKNKTAGSNCVVTAVGVSLPQ